MAGYGAYETPHEIQMDDIDSAPGYGRSGSLNEYANLYNEPQTDAGPTSSSSTLGRNLDRKGTKKSAAARGMKKATNNSALAAAANTGKNKWARAMVCGLAIALMWMTSVGVAKSIVYAWIVAPGFDDVLATWNRTYVEAGLAEVKYTECAESLLLNCNKRMNESFTKAAESHSVNTVTNAAKIENSRTRLEFCADDYLTKSLGTLRNWEKAVRQWANDPVYQVLRFKTDPACTDNDKTAIGKFLVEETTLGTQSLTLVSNYAEKSRLLNEKSRRSMQERLDYDRNFFLGGFANFSLGIDGFNIPLNTSLIDNPFSGLSTEALDSLIFSFDTEFKGVNASIMAAYNTMLGKANKVVDDATQAYNDMKQQLAELNKFLQDSKATIFSMANALPPAPDITAITVGFPDSLTPDLDLPGGQFNNLGQYLDVNFACAGCVPDITLPTIDTTGFTNALDDAKNEITTGVQATLDGAKDLIPKVPDLNTDYNPPDVIIELNKNQAEHDNLTNTFADQNTALLQGLAGLARIGTSAKNASGVGLQSLLELGDTLSQRSLSFDTCFGCEGPDIEAIIDITDILSFLILGFDYAWRAIHTFYLINKYWFHSAVGLPTIDIRQWISSNRQAGPIQKIGGIIFSPLSFCFALLFFAFLVVVLILSAYLPFVKDYSYGCVTSSPPAGTSLSNLSSSVIINYASTDGNKLMLNGIDEYDVQRSDKCGSILKDSSNDYAVQKQEMANIIDAFNGNTEGMERLERCIDYSTWYHMGDIATTPIQNSQVNALFGGGDPTYARPTFVVPVNCRSTGLDEFLPLEPNTFKCEDVPQCDRSGVAGANVTDPANLGFNASGVPTTEGFEGVVAASAQSACSGPNRDDLTTSALISSCQSEKFIHAGILRVFVTVVCWACLQGSRLLIMGGVRRVFWRDLTQHGFTFIGSCNRLGKIEPENYKELLEEKTNLTIMKFERGAFILFMCAIAANLPWLGLTAYFAETI